jgi:hypothetical protein
VERLAELVAGGTAAWENLLSVDVRHYITEYIPKKNPVKNTFFNAVLRSLSSSFAVQIHPANAFLGTNTT